MARLVRAGGAIFAGVPYAHGPLCVQPQFARTQVGKWIDSPFRLPLSCSAVKLLEDQALKERGEGNTRPEAIAHEVLKAHRPNDAGPNRKEFPTFH